MWPVEFNDYLKKNSKNIASEIIAETAIDFSHEKILSCGLKNITKNEAIHN